jgi:hypothetical protein
VHASDEKMKMRTVKLTSKFLTEAIQGKAELFASNLPDDVQLLDIKFDLCSNEVFAVIRSDKFADVAELYPIPEFKITYASIPRTEATDSSLKPGYKTDTRTIPEAQQDAKRREQLTQSTNNIENEFSPEQRQLLSFKVEGETIVAKPTQFLKAEWEDINEVVKSLGGRWVKGDIISYWEIPLLQN